MSNLDQEFPVTIEIVTPVSAKNAAVALVVAERAARDAFGGSVAVRVSTEAMSIESGAAA